MVSFRYLSHATNILTARINGRNFSGNAQTGISLIGHVESIPTSDKLCWFIIKRVRRKGRTTLVFRDRHRIMAKCSLVSLKPPRILKNSHPSWFRRFRKNHNSKSSVSPRSRKRDCRRQKVNYSIVNVDGTLSFVHSFLKVYPL